jgi:hypothetical protein
VLSQVLDKPGGISFVSGHQMPGTGGGTWTLGQIEAAERSSRSIRSSGNTATIWIGYLDGSYAPDSSTLGLAFDATSAVVFRDQIDQATTAVVNEAGIERAVLTHETGHLLGLVNIGYKSKYDHEDPQHPHHSNDKNSVMYWAVDDTAVESLLEGGPPDTFDQYDTADIESFKS